MGTLWARSWGTEATWAVGNRLIATVESGQTLNRIHFGFRWTGVTSNEQSFEALLTDFLAVGIVTQTSAHGTTPPDALTGATDANPPLERWLWWGTVAMVPAIMGTDHPDVMVWTTSADEVILDTQGQVKANVPIGQSLGVYLTWSPWATDGWATRGPVNGRSWSSCLLTV